MRLDRCFKVASCLLLGCQLGFAQDPQVSPESIVQRNIETCNRRNLEAFATTYAPEIEILVLATGATRVKGMVELKAIHHARFQNNPKLRAEVASRCIQCPLVTDMERLTGLLSQPGGTELGPIAVLVISDVRNGEITRAWFAR